MLLGQNTEAGYVDAKQGAFMGGGWGLMFQSCQSCAALFLGKHDEISLFIHILML